MCIKKFGVSAVVLCALSFGSQAGLAGTIVDFMPEPASPTLPEFVWTGAALTSGTGSIGTGFGSLGPGDGELATGAQFAPGLQLETPFTVLGIPGSEVSLSGATSFYDTTLLLTGLAASGPAVSVAGYVVQPLGSGAFELWSTDPIDAFEDNPVLLLSGTITSAAIGGFLGNSSGGVATLDLAVTYTGGAILAAAGDIPLSGQFSWSLLDISPKLMVADRTGNLRAFTANGVGQFSVIPEPATMALLGLGILLMIRRRAH